MPIDTVLTYFIYIHNLKYSTYTVFINRQRNLGERSHIKYNRPSDPFYI